MLGRVNHPYMDGWKMNFLLGKAHFQSGHVSFRENYLEAK